MPYIQKLMNLVESQPAKTYDTSVLSSALGRCYLQNLSERDHEDITRLTEASSDLLDLDKPPVSHTDPVMIRTFLGQLQRLSVLSSGSEVQKVLGQKLAKDIGKKVKKLAGDVARLKYDREWLHPVDAIQQMFGMSGMWDNASEIARSELKDKDSTTHHPANPEGFLMKITQTETRRLIEFVIKEIFQMRVPQRLEDYTLSDVAGHHLYWTTQENRVHYVTPAHYDLATQFSFDIPHNAAHIAHLDAHPTISVSTYVDTMAQRAYFESVAVLSEHHFIDILRKNPEKIEGMHAVLDERRGVNPKDFSRWLLADRVFEARLRVARLIADQLTLDGLEFNRVVHEVAHKTGLTESEATQEAEKYYTHTGLGAVYVLGPQKLTKQGIINPKDAILRGTDKVVRSWEERGG